MLGTSNCFRSLRSALQALRKDTRGATVLLFALTVPIVIATTGAAVNFARISNADVVLQASADAAVLAAADQMYSGRLTDRQVIELAEDVFAENVKDEDGLFITPPRIAVTIDRENDLITARAEGDVQNLIRFVENLAKTTVPVNAQASFAILNVELSMALDLTGSMSGGKIDDLKEASKSVVNQLMDLNRSRMRFDEGVRIALAPYSAAVNAGDLTDDVTGVPAASALDCVVGRDNAEDTAPRRDWIPQDPRAYCPSSEIVTLTKNRNKLINEISGFRTGGCTAGHLGIAWTYYTLSPRWNRVMPSESKIRPFGEDTTMKVAIIMTDGEFNTAYTGVSGNPICSGAGRAKSEDMARDLCGEMRRDGILVYSVAFKAPTSAERLLRDCAGDDNRYFETDTGNELVQAFEDIANDVKSLRLTM